MVCRRPILWIIFFTIVSVVNGKPPKAIVGGSDAENHEFPYNVALKIMNQYFCGGSIIDSRHILTAAHCLYNKPIDLISSLTILAGTNNITSQTGTVYHPKKIHRHPSYPFYNTRTNDLAIITLVEEIQFDEYKKALKLPTEDVPGDVTAIASGWGDFYHPKGATPSMLRKLELLVIAKGKCFLPPSIVVYHNQLCALPKRGSGLCTGDSGSPLVYDGTIVGIASWVFPCALGYPDVFTRVFSHIDWIKSVINETTID